MKQKGYILLEVLVASTLLSLAGSSFYSGLSQAIRMERAVRAMDALYDPIKFLWMRSTKDLRNMVSLRDHRFKGEEDEMEFPVLGEASRLSFIRYFVKDRSLVRTQENLPHNFVKDSPAESILLKNIESIRFEYAYLDQEERLVFKSEWREEPYFGLPRAVKMTLKLKSEGKVFSRLISVPHGRWGHVVEEGEKQ